MLTLSAGSIALAVVTAAPAQAEIAMGAEDPAALVRALREMGFAPEPLDLFGAPSTTIAIGDGRYFVILGGCNNRKTACQTVMVGARFTDVKAPPLDWINTQNESYDLIKLWRNKAGELGYSVQAPARGMTRTNFRALVDGLISGEGSVATDAKDAKLVQE